MGRKKKEQPSEWISGLEATRILSENSGRIIHEAYIRVLVKKGIITARQFSGNANQYKRSEVENYVVKPRRKKIAETEQQDRLPDVA